MVLSLRHRLASEQTALTLGKEQLNSRGQLTLMLQHHRTEEEKQGGHSPSNLRREDIQLAAPNVLHGAPCGNERRLVLCCGDGGGCTQLALRRHVGTNYPNTLQTARRSTRHKSRVWLCLGYLGVADLATDVGPDELLVGLLAVVRHNTAASSFMDDGEHARFNSHIACRL